MSTFNLTLNQGEVTSRDRADLRRGELVKTLGSEYKKGDPTRLHKIKSRSEFGDLAADFGESSVIGCKICQFNSGSDQLLALAGNVLYGSTPGTTGTFSILSTSKSGSNTHLSAANFLDRWFVVTGFDENLVLKSDGTIRVMGMQAPQTQPVPTAAAASGSVARANNTAAANSGFSNFANSVDGDLTTYATGTRSTVGTATATWDWPADATSGKSLYVNYRLAGQQPANVAPIGGADVPAAIAAADSGFQVTVTLEVSEDAGVTFATALEETHSSFMSQAEPFQIPVTGNSNLIQFRATLTYTSGTSPATLRVADVKLQVGVPASEVANFSTTTGLYYAFTEWNDTDGIESPPSPESVLIGLSTQNSMSLALPSSTQNPATTHWKIYRTADGGTVPQDLGYMGKIPSDQTTWTDGFDPFLHNEQPTPPLPLLSVTYRASEAASSGTLYFVRDQPPPRLRHINSYRGTLVGPDRDKPQKLFAALPGFPESWPEINVIEQFDFPEHSSIIGTMTVGDVLVVAADGLMIALDDIPTVNNGVVNLPRVRSLQGQPGAVSSKSLAVVSVKGESNAAWVSREGIHLTNGFLSERLTDDADWDAKVDIASLGSAVLEWNPDKLQLKFCYDSDGSGTNDSFALIHLAEDNRKSSGRPKITWDHPAGIADLTTAYVGGVLRQYSAGNDGKVYLEEAAGSTTMNWKSGRIYLDWDNMELLRGNLRHTSAGIGQTGTLTVTVGRDSGATDSVTKTIALNGHKGTEFFIGRAGEWFEVEFTYTGTADLSLQDLRLLVNKIADAGELIS